MRGSNWEIQAGDGMEYCELHHFLPALAPLHIFNLTLVVSPYVFLTATRPYFKRAENFHEPTTDHQKDNSLFYETKFHGKGGPMHNTYSATYGASHRHWHQTLNNLGVSTNNSHFSGSNVGCWTTITAVSPEKRDRCYSATAYYLPARERRNLHLLTDALAQKVVMEQEGQAWVAKGVRFIHNIEEHVVKTKGEVIICGGSVSSPQLLELSGIGAPDVLQAAGIPCKINNPNVGENFQEHMSRFLYDLRLFRSHVNSAFISDRNDL